MRGGKGFNATTLLLGVLVLLVAGMAGYIIMTRSAPQESEKARRSVLVTEDNIDEVVRQSKTDLPVVSSYIVSMNSDWTFPDGDSESTNAFVANSKRNNWPVWFDVTLNDGRTVFESPVMPVDTNIQKFKLDESLPQGTYSGSVTYHVVDDDQNQNELTSLSVGVTIRVEN